MSPNQNPIKSNPASQSLQVQDGNQQSGGASLSTMAPPKSIGEDYQRRQFTTCLEANRAGHLSGNGSYRALAPLPLTQATSQHINRPKSALSTPLTPAPTTSDVHNRVDYSGSGCSSLCSTSSAESSGCILGAPPCSNEILRRYLKVDPKESSLAYLASIAIKEGVVQDGEDMYTRKCEEEEGWGVQNRIGSDSSRTLGRSEENN